jgi:hypothetical protein
LIGLVEDDASLGEVVASSARAPIKPKALVI